MEKLERAANSSIRMGEMSVAAGGDKLRTLLGSCIGLALYDRRTQRLAGWRISYCQIARENTDRPGKFVDTAIPALIEQWSSLPAAN